MFLQQVINGLATGGIYTLVALGLTLVYGVLKILHIAHAGIYALGAYLALIAYRIYPNIYFAFAFAMVGTAIGGYLVQKYLYWPILDKPRIVPLIASIGLFLALEELYRLIWGPYVIPFPQKFHWKSYNLGHIRLPGSDLFVFALSLFFLFILYWIVNRTKVGLAMRAVSDDKEVAEASGIDSKWIIALSFIIGSALAGAAGLMVGVYYNSIYPTMGDVPAYKSLAIIVVGGMGSIEGTVIAGFGLGLLEALLIGYLPFAFPRDALAFIAMIIFLLIKPEGLFSR